MGGENEGCMEYLGIAMEALRETHNALSDTEDLNEIEPLKNTIKAINDKLCQSYHALKERTDPQI